ncbi:hypothetical protein GCM10027063_22630 [Promicromonospora xylanilytica]
MRLTFARATHAAAAAAAALALTAALAAPGEGTPPASGSEPHTKPDAPVVWAHRGASKVTPEETTAAYQRALADRAGVLEGDIAQTKDGELVVIHDDTLSRTTDVEEVFPDRAPWNVRDFTLEEIRQLDAGSWFSPAHAGEKILTMREWFALNDGRAGLAPEIKNPDLYPGIVRNVADELRHWGYTQDLRARNGAPLIYVQSFSEPALRELDALLPDVPLFALASGYTYFNADDDVLAELATWADAVAAHPARTTATQVARAQSFGLEVVSEVDDSPVLIEMAADQGYDVAFTNVPDVARAVLAGKDPFRRAGDVVIDKIVADAPGDDLQPENGEHVVLRNTSDRPVDLTGYVVRDYGNAVLRVADGAVIDPGSLYRVYVGPGTDRADATYDGRTSAVLGNSGTEHAYLYDPSGDIVSITHVTAP